MGHQTTTTNNYNYYYYYYYYYNYYYYYYYYYVKVAQIVILSCFRPLSISNLVKNCTFVRFQLVCDRQMDGRTDQRTNGRTDGQTDRWTHPLIEMRERI